MHIQCETRLSYHRADLAEEGLAAEAVADASQEQTHTVTAEAVADASQEKTHTVTAEAVADGSQEQTHTVTAASDEADVDVDDDSSPTGGPVKQQSDKAADDAEEMQVDKGDERLIRAEDDPGQVGLAATTTCMCLNDMRACRG